MSQIHLYLYVFFHSKHTQTVTISEQKEQIDLMNNKKKGNQMK